PLRSVLGGAHRAPGPEPAGETSPPWGDTKGRWSPVATVHRRPRRQPRPRSPPLKNLIFRKQESPSRCDKPAHRTNQRNGRGQGEGIVRATPSVTPRRDTSLKEGGRLPLWGRRCPVGTVLRRPNRQVRRWPGRAGPEGVFPER